MALGASLAVAVPAAAQGLGPPSKCAGPSLGGRPTARLPAVPGLALPFNQVESLCVELFFVADWIVPIPDEFPDEGFWDLATPVRRLPASQQPVAFRIETIGAAGNKFRLHLSGNIESRDLPFYRHLQVGRFELKPAADGSQRTRTDFVGVPDMGGDWGSAAVRRTYVLGQLDLQNTDFRTEGVTFELVGTDPGISLNNASFDQRFSHLYQTPGVRSFTITAGRPGEPSRNEFRLDGMTPLVMPLIRVDVQPGSSLTFGYMGELEGSHTPFRLEGSVEMTVAEGAVLGLEYANLAAYRRYAHSGTSTLTLRGGALQIVGSGSRLTFEGTVRTEPSSMAGAPTPRIDLARNAWLVADRLANEHTDMEITLKTGSRLSLGSVGVGRSNAPVGSTPPSLTVAADDRSNGSNPTVDIGVLNISGAGSHVEFVSRDPQGQGLSVEAGLLTQSGGSLRVGAGVTFTADNKLAEGGELRIDAGGRLNLTGTQAWMLGPRWQSVINNGNIGVNGLQARLLVQTPAGQATTLGGSGTILLGLTAADAATPGNGLYAGSIVFEHAATLRTSNTLDFAASQSGKTPSGVVARIDPTPGAPRASLLHTSSYAYGIDQVGFRFQPASTSPPRAAADYVAGGEYLVLKADGGIRLSNRAVTTTGEPAALALGPDMPATLDARLVGNPLLTGEVRVRFIEMGLKHLVTKTGDRRNPTSLLAALVAAAGGANGVLPSGVRVGEALAGLSNGELARAANAHAEPYSSFMAVSAQSVNTVARRAIERAMVTHRGACAAGDAAAAAGTAPGASAAALPGALACAGGRVAWIDAGSTQGEVWAQADLAGFGYRVREHSAGLDLWGDATRTLGAFLGRTYVTMDEHDFVTSRFSREGWQLGTYANWRPDAAWSVAAAAGWTHGDIDATRTISDVGQLRGGTARGATRSHGLFAGLQVQRRMPTEIPSAWWAPTASVRWSRHRMAGLTESGGGDFGFRIESAATRSLVTAVGLEGGFGWISGGTHWTLAAHARYEHDHAAQARAAHEVTATHALYGRFTQVGANAGAYAAVAGLTLGMRFALQGVLALTATQAQRQHGQDQSLRASLDWRW